MATTRSKEKREFVAKIISSVKKAFTTLADFSGERKMARRGRHVSE